MKTLNLALACLLFPALTFARLNETEAQLTNRYGAPGLRAPERVVDGQGSAVVIGEKLTFEADGWHIEAVVVEGRCARIIFHKPGEWAVEQCNYLLNIHGGRDRWREQKPPAKQTDMSKDRSWKRDDGLTANWVRLRPTNLGPAFEITSPAYARAIEAVRKAAGDKAKKVPNF